jgi:intraflagellar transport protein 80
MMKLKVKKSDKQIHQEVVSAVCWAPNNQLYSLSDDKTICIWDINGEYVSKYQDLDCYCTALEWAPGLKSGNDALAIGTSDGGLRIIGRGGKMDKFDNAHTTAVRITYFYIIS